MCHIGQCNTAMKKVLQSTVYLIPLLFLFLLCSHNSVPEIDPTRITTPGYIGTKDEFINDSIKQADFGNWKLIRHINYYYAEKYSGEITPLDYIMFVNIAGFETEKFGIATGPDDDSRFTKDGGKTWIKAKGGEVFCRFGLDIVNGNVVWNNGNGGLKYTLNGGRSWNTASAIQCLPYIAFYSTDIGWIATSFNVLSTIDRGKTFQQISLPANDMRIAAISLRTQSEGYLLDSKGTLYRTDDFGKTWTSSSIGLTEGEMLFSGTHIRAAVRFTDTQKGRIVFVKQDASICTLTTIDGGVTWERNEISVLKNRNEYFQVYLSRNAEILTLTGNFQDRNESFVLKYKE